jgi:hypothetical protein
MKTLWLLITVLFVSLSAFSQDTVFKTDGELIAAKVLEVSSTEIRYRLEADTTGPVYVLPKTDVYMVEYASGRKEVFASQNTEKSEAEKSRVKKEMTELEILYQRRKGSGIAGTIIGSVGVFTTTIIFADGMIKMQSRTGDLKNRERNKVIASGAAFVISAVTLVAGIHGLVKASVIKERIRKGEVAINPVLIDGMSYNGASVSSNTAIGIGVKYLF